MINFDQIKQNHCRRIPLIQKYVNLLKIGFVILDDPLKIPNESERKKNHARDIKKGSDNLISTN